MTVKPKVTAMRKLIQLLMFGTAMMLPTLVNATAICGRAQIDVGDSSTRNGVVSTTVSVDSNVWTVLHTLANGQVIDRSIQYLMIDNSNDHRTQWRGKLAGFPQFDMVGELMTINATGQPVYHEWLYKNGRLITHSMSLCRIDIAPVDSVQTPSS
jgi:hypothetical protein